MQKAVDVFGNWAKQGKYRGMEKGHAAAVKEMLNFAYHERCELGEKFSFLDLGCGNGWVVRQVAENGLCKRAVGVDGAQQMIFNAESRDSKMVKRLRTEMDQLWVSTQIQWKSWMHGIKLDLIMVVLLSKIHPV